MKTINLFLDVDEYEYDLYYCEANSYCSNTVGSYLYTSDHKYRLEQNGPSICQLFWYKMIYLAA